MIRDRKETSKKMLSIIPTETPNQHVRFWQSVLRLTKVNCRESEETIAILLLPVKKLQAGRWRTRRG